MNGLARWESNLASVHKMLSTLKAFIKYYAPRTVLKINPDYRIKTATGSPRHQGTRCAGLKGISDMHDLKSKTNKSPITIK